ncbi:MAG: lipopolysaccharide assembly LapA domain-containing protein [Actinomycetes bacterium]
MSMPHHDSGHSNEPGGSHGRTGFEWTPRAVATVIGLVVALIFILSNQQTAPIQFLWWEHSLPVWVALLVATSLGLIVGAGLGYRRGKRSGSGPTQKK